MFGRRPACSACPIAATVNNAKHHGSERSSMAHLNSQEWAETYDTVRSWGRGSKDSWLVSACSAPGGEFEKS
jgi:hypothetical protein